VRILALAPADEAQRYEKGQPPKGARLFLQPHLDVRRVAALAEGEDFSYHDERVEVLETDGPVQLALVYVDFGMEERTRALLHSAGQLGPALLFGPQPTSWGDAAPEWARHRVVGDICHVWPEIRADAASGRLKPVYRAPQTPVYVAPRHCDGWNRELDLTHQTMSFAVGCTHAAPDRGLCPQYLYYGDKVHFRSKEELIGELLTLPHKRIQLLDEDVARFPEYYYDMFRELWSYRRQWVVNASERLFRYPRFIRLLAKTGTRIVFLDESFLGRRIETACRDGRMVRSLRRHVKQLQSAKMLVGARLRLRLDSDRPLDFPRIAAVLQQADLDFVELSYVRGTGPGEAQVRVAYRPMLSEQDPAWVKNSFYSLGAIADRVARRPRRVGFYTTMLYLLPYSMAYRQNFLEGIPGP
jgi:AcrR family transcriptional regulator